MSPGAVKAGEKQLNMNPSPLLLAVPAAFDFTASSLMFVALTMTPASVYQMMRGFVTVFAAMFSVIFLKKKQYRHHILGLAMIFVALVEVGIVAIFLGKPDDNLVGSVADRGTLQWQREPDQGDAGGGSGQLALTNSPLQVLDLAFGIIQLSGDPLTVFKGGDA